MPATFPEKVYSLLSSEDTNEVIRWGQEGYGFQVLDPKKFSSDIMPKYFRHCRYTSFQRQLNLYGFRRVSKGPDTGTYYHPKFRRDRPELIPSIKRIPSRSKRETDSASSTSSLTTSGSWSSMDSLDSYPCHSDVDKDLKPQLPRYQSNILLEIIRENNARPFDVDNPTVSKLTSNLLRLSNVNEQGGGDQLLKKQPSLLQPSLPGNDVLIKNSGAKSYCNFPSNHANGTNFKLAFGPKTGIHVGLGNHTYVPFFLGGSSSLSNNLLRGRKVNHQTSRMGKSATLTPCFLNSMNGEA